MFLAKYEPAISVGKYKWDYKWNNEVEETYLLNRYLFWDFSGVKFMHSCEFRFYTVTP